MNETGRSLLVMRIAAVVALILGGFLLLSSWDGLYDTLDLPQGLPALSSQLGGASLIALAYLLWAASPSPELSQIAAVTGLIANGGGALIIAGWLIFRDPTDDLRVDTLGTVILSVVAVILALLALGLGRVALTASNRLK